MSNNSDQNIAIEVKDISKDFRVYKDKSHTLKDRILFHKRNSYELNHVLDHVSFTVKKGEALGLIGHNGCGKSTTLKLLNKILYPDSGSIVMHGRVSSLIELGAGFHPDMTGRENIYINASIFGLKKAEIERRLDKIIRFSELEDFIDNPVRTYSSGMYMRLAFAIAINVDADILLVDEILAVGDANFQKKCFDKLESIKEHGTAIVIVSHSMDQIKKICNKVIWLDGGKIKEQGLPKAVCQDYLNLMNEKAAERHALELEETGSVDSDPTLKYPVQKVSSQASKLAIRKGNMHARFSQVSLKNSDGNLSNKFPVDIHMSLDMTLQSDIDLEDADILVEIFNKYGGNCVTVLRSRDLNEFIPLKKGQSTNIRLSLSGMRLVQGDYYFVLVLRDKDRIVYDELDHVIEFSVVPKVDLEFENVGVVIPDKKWEMIDNNRADF